MTSRRPIGAFDDPAVAVGPVLAGLLELPDADDVLRRAFDEAHARAASLVVLAAGRAADQGAEPVLRDEVVRWSEKYPRVAVTVTRWPDYDSAIALTAGTAGCVLAVVAEPHDPREAAIVASAVRRAHCPVAVLPARAAARAEGAGAG